MKLRLRCKSGRSGIDVRGVNIYLNRVDGGFGCGQSLIRGVADFVVDLGFQILNLLLIQQYFANKKKRKF
jgi:hypothetical protein